MSKVEFLNHRLGLKNHLYRFIWSIAWALLVKPIPRTYANPWKIFILRLFGARVSSTSLVYSSVLIYDPRKLIMESGSCLGPNVDCYNVDFVHLKMNSLVSQKSYLCTASHDIKGTGFKLITAPIIVQENVWIAADVFVGMGVTIGENSIVGARSSVFKDVPPNVIVGGNPAKFIKNRF